MIFILALQIALIPSLNWWVKIPGNILRSNYSELAAFEATRGPDWTEIKDIRRHVGSVRTVFISHEYAVRYFWLNMVAPDLIIPYAWQSSIAIPLPATDEDLKLALKKLNFSQFILPNDEVSSGKLPAVSARIIHKNKIYTLFSLD